MTVGELITALMAFPSGMRVVIPGYEQGFEDAEPVATIEIRPNLKTEWYYGPHWRAGSKYHEDEAHRSGRELPAIETAVVIGTENG